MLAESAGLGKTEQTWYYKSILEPDDVTNALFEKVMILNTISPDEFDWLQGKDGPEKDEGIGGFKIYIEGAVVQASVFSGVSGSAADKAEAAAKESNEGLYVLLNPVVEP